MVKEIIRNILLISLLFGAMTIVLFRVQDNYTVDWLSLLGTILSASYIISCRNPYNYLVFIPGVISSILLGMAFLDSNLNGSVSYLGVFLPAQIYSFFIWRRKALAHLSEGNRAVAAPRWQTGKERIYTFIALIGLMALNALVNRHFNPGYSGIALFFDALFFATSILANVLLVYKLTESRILWVIFSLAGLGLAICLNTINFYMIEMFVLFLVINVIVLINWIKASKIAISHGN